MEKATRIRLAEIAYQKALIPFHGYIEGNTSNLQPIIEHFPTWNIKDADKLWCAAFVYYCCIEAGYEIPYRPNECVTCHLAGCIAWEEFAVQNTQLEYHQMDSSFTPQAGDIVIFDYVFCNQEHDHIGIIVKVKETTIIVAEGNIPHQNKSGIVERAIDNHIRGFIRIPDGFRY